MSKEIQKISRPGISMGDKFLKIIKLETYSGGLNTIVINIFMARKSPVLIIYGLCRCLTVSTYTTSPNQCSFRILKW